MRNSANDAVVIYNETPESGEGVHIGQGPAQLVVSQSHGNQLSQVAKSWWNFTTQRVVEQKQFLEIREIAQL